MKKCIFEKCIICFELMVDNIYTIQNCNHKYHKKCIKMWYNIKNECPMCRRLFIDNNFISLRLEQIERENTTIKILIMICMLYFYTLFQYIIFI